MGRRTLDNIDNKIIKAVIKEGAEYGVSNVSTLRISKKLGISEGTIFVHFNSKPNLMKSAHDKVTETFNYLYDELMNCDYERKTLYKIFFELLKTMQKNPNCTRFIQSYYSSLRPDHPFYQKDKYIKVVNSIISKYGNKPFDDNTADKVWRIIIFSILRYASMQDSEGIKIEDTKETKFMFKLILGHLTEKFVADLD